MIIIKDETHLKNCEVKVKKLVQSLAKALNCEILDVREIVYEKELFDTIRKFKSKEKPFILLAGDKNNEAEKTIFKYLIRSPFKFKIHNYETSTPDKKVSEVLCTLDFSCLWCKHICFRKNSKMPVCKNRHSEFFKSKRKLEDFVPECFELNKDYLKRKYIFYF